MKHAMRERKRGREKNLHGGSNQKSLIVRCVDFEFDNQRLKKRGREAAKREPVVLYKNQSSWEIETEREWSYLV